MFGLASLVLRSKLRTLVFRDLFDRVDRAALLSTSTLGSRYSVDFNVVVVSLFSTLNIIQFYKWMIWYERKSMFWTPVSMGGPCGCMALLAYLVLCSTADYSVFGMIAACIWYSSNVTNCGDSFRERRLIRVPRSHEVLLKTLIQIIQDEYEQPVCWIHIQGLRPPIHLAIDVIPGTRRTGEDLALVLENRKMMGVMRSKTSMARIGNLNNGPANRR